MEREVESNLEQLIKNMYHNNSASENLSKIVDDILDHDRLDFKGVFQLLIQDESARVSLIKEESETQLLRIIQNENLSKQFIIELIDGYWCHNTQLFESAYKKDTFFKLVKFYTKMSSFEKNKDEIINFVEGHSGWKLQDKLLKILRSSTAI